MTPVNFAGDEHVGVYREGLIELLGVANWPEGARVVVSLAPPEPSDGPASGGEVVIAGFGLAGRCVADVVERMGRPYQVIEQNPATVATQRSLGRRIVEGNVADRKTLEAARVHKASALALTIPDEQAVLCATELARAMNPDLYIIARTTYASCGMRAAQLGADDVVKSEQAVALQFYETLRKKLSGDGRVGD
jgi:CPA2 family monovalent cation:H+ antiporter-2